MSRPTDPFELGPDDVGLEAVEHELEAFADETRLAPAADLTDRIMAAIAAEPVPTPPVTFLHAVGALALVDAWRAWRLNLRVASGAGRASGRLRVQALAVVVVAALLVGLGGTTVAVGAAQLVQAIVTPQVTDPDATLTPEVTTAPDVVTPTPSPAPVASVSPDPSSPDASDEPAGSAGPDESSEPQESNDSSGGSSGSRRTATPRPDRTPDPDETETPDPDETETPDPDETETPDPDETETPKPTSTSSRLPSAIAI